VEYINDVDWIEKLLRIVSIGKVSCQRLQIFAMHCYKDLREEASTEI
jgi:hypothetical protein